jgi:hypothetical protein
MAQYDGALVPYGPDRIGHDVPRDQQITKQELQLMALCENSLVVIKDLPAHLRIKSSGLAWVRYALVDLDAPAIKSGKRPRLSGLNDIEALMPPRAILLCNCAVEITQHLAHLSKKHDKHEQVQRSPVGHILTFTYAKETAAGYELIGMTAILPFNKVR